MKTFRLIGVALVAVVMCLGFAACSSDDDPAEADLSKIIIGVWEQDGDNDIMALKSDKTLLWYSNEKHYLENDMLATYKWELQGDCLYFIDEDGERFQELRLQEVSTNTIVWKDYGSPGGSDSYDLWTWTRYNK